MGAHGVFFDEDDATAAAARLQSGGWEATLARGRFHGEDDDEDQPWLLTTDAPEVALELAVEEFGGWFEVEPSPQTQVPALPPLKLPTAPKRIKRGEAPD